MNWLSRKKRQNSWRLRRIRSSSIYRGLKSLRKREERPFNMKQKWASVELSIKFNWSFNEISKRCNIKSRWSRKPGSATKRVYKDRKK